MLKISCKSFFKGSKKLSVSFSALAVIRSSHRMELRLAAESREWNQACLPNVENKVVFPEYREWHKVLNMFLFYKATVTEIETVHSAERKKWNKTYSSTAGIKLSQMQRITRNFNISANLNYIRNKVKVWISKWTRQIHVIKKTKGPKISCHRVGWFLPFLHF